MPDQYTYAELRWLPIEDVLAELSEAELSEATGIHSFFIHGWKYEPSKYTGTYMELDDLMAKRIRDWLEAQTDAAIRGIA